jgi:hypothetical protein
MLRGALVNVAIASKHIGLIELLPQQAAAFLPEDSV